MGEKGSRHVRGPVLEGDALIELHPKNGPSVPVQGEEAMDLMSDQVADGRRFRVLNAVERGYPKAVVVDNGPEFRGLAMDQWAYRHGVELLFIEPGRLVQNAYFESFNGRLRDECLHSEWFVGLQDAIEKIEAWRIDYNEVGPHGSLGQVPPAEFAFTLKRQPGQRGDRAMR